MKDKRKQIRISHAHLIAAVETHLRALSIMNDDEVITQLTDLDPSVAYIERIKNEVSA